jgi:hypothetical protein
MMPDILAFIGRHSAEFITGVFAVKIGLAKTRFDRSIEDAILRTLPYFFLNKTVTP